MKQMMRRQSILFSVMHSLLASIPANAASVPDYIVPAKTSVPFTYCIWYLPDPLDASFLKKLQEAPPDLFHLGYQIPFKGGLGPTYGHELYTDSILAADQIPREITRIKKVLEEMRAGGVSRIIPYVYTMAFFGQADERTGFFHFYDQWDQYNSFGLGSKPPADPSLWTQVTGPQQLGGGPPGILHYEPCINHPAWAEYLNLVVQQAAAVGYNGMFFDVNTLYCFCPHCQEKFDIYLLEKYGRKGLRQAFGTKDHRILNLSTIYRDFQYTVLAAFKPYLAEIWQRENLGLVLGAKDTSKVKLEEDWRLLRCYMQQSQAEYPPQNQFKRFLTDQFSADFADKVAPEKRNAFIQTVLRKYFQNFLASSELSEILHKKFGSSDIRRRCCTNPRELLLWVETQRFWCKSMADQFARLKHIGQNTCTDQGRKENFYTVANLGSMLTMDALNKRRVDAINLDYWAPSADMQMFEEMPQPGMLETGVLISNIFAFRWAMAAGTRAGTLLYKSISDRASDLSHAEVAAGGGGAFIQPGLDAPESRKRWKKFFAENSDLWSNGDSWAQVGLLFWSDQIFYEFPEHDAMTRRLVSILSENQIPFDMVTEKNEQDLSGYSLLIAPMLRYLDDGQIQRLRDYVKNGGSLLIIDPFGTENKWGQSRSEDPGQSLCASTGEFKSGRYGRGLVIRLADADVPSRRSDIWCLMEERANAFVPARDYLNASRRLDRQNHLDLGQRFISDLEKAFNIRLRWCPKLTNPGVYVHAYHCPPGARSPERIIVHAVNYNIPIVLEKAGDTQGEMIWSAETRSGPPHAAKNIQITVTLPADSRVQQVRVLSPTETSQAVPWSVQNQQVTLTVKQLEIYQALVLHLVKKN